MKPKIALFSGGFSSERNISVKSATNVYSALKNDCDVMLIDIQKNNWEHAISGETLWMEVPSGTICTSTHQWRPDYAIVMVHGTPGEDGILQGLLELCSIPYSTGSVLNMATTFDKGVTIALLEKKGFPVAKSTLIKANTAFNHTLRYPLFCKPCQAGSSFGISLVNTPEELAGAIEKAAQEDPNILLEEKIEGREISCGVFKDKNGKTIVLPSTEIITSRTFFDYEAKYQGLSEEITPASLSESEKAALNEISSQIYQTLHCKGIVRIDYILHPDNGFVIIEVNTVPGFSNESIVPQQLKHENIAVSEVFHFS